MRAIINKVLKNSNGTMGACEVTISDGNMNFTLDACNDEDIKNIGVPIDIDVCLYSECFRTYNNKSVQTESICAVRGKRELETYCVVNGKVSRVDTFNKDIRLEIKCLGKDLTVICYNGKNESVNVGDTVSALCWIQVIENRPWDEKNGS